MLGAVLAACGSGDGTSPKVVDPPAGYASSADDAVRFLRNAYLNLDLDALDKVLAPEFQFQLDPADVDTLKIDDTWDRAKHMLWAEHVFSGLPGIRADGSVQNPVMAQGLEVTWTPAGDWTEITDGPWADTMQRDFDSFSSVQYFSFDYDFVEGAQIFNVLQRDLPVGDAVARI